MDIRQRSSVSNSKKIPHFPLVPDPRREVTPVKDHHICLPAAALYNPLYIYSYWYQLHLYARNSILLNATRVAKWSYYACLWFPTSFPTEFLPLIFLRQQCSLSLQILGSLSMAMHIRAFLYFRRPEGPSFSAFTLNIYCYC